MTKPTLIAPDAALGTVKSNEIRYCYKIQYSSDLASCDFHKSLIHKDIQNNLTLVSTIYIQLIAN